MVSNAFLRTFKRLEKSIKFCSHKQKLFSNFHSTKMLETPRIDPDIHAHIFFVVQTTTLAPSGNIPTGNAPVPIAPLSSMIRLCPNATWNQNYSIIANSTYGNNATTFSNAVDFFLDNDSSIYVSDSENYRIEKFILGNPMGTTVANTFPFQPAALYVDGGGAIYSCEQAVCVTG
jgi:sugar lactone lactonase YvrE